MKRGAKLIVVKDLRKVYKLSKREMAKEKIKDNTKIAVDGISFEAKPGEIFGLLGPNGAGKTTTLRCIATLYKPTDGAITVKDLDIEKYPEKVRSCIGFLTNELKLDPHFTAQYTMNYFGKLYGMDQKKIDERTKEIFERFDITKFKDKKIEEFSTGMKQKLSIAVSLIHDPSVIIFDEPTNGLDIITARSVTDYLVEMKERGKVVVISTHIMDVVEKLCDRVGIILNGKIIALGTVDEICQDMMCSNLEDAFFALYKKHSKGEDDIA